MQPLQARRVRFVLLVLLLLVVAVIFLIPEVRSTFKNLGENYGYLGLFIVSLIGGVSLIFPLPYPLILIGLAGAGYNPLLLALVAALGATGGDLVSYLLGQTGGSAFPKKLEPVRDFIEKYTKKYPRIGILFLLLWASFSPFPNEVFVIPFGIVRYGLWNTLIITLPGNFVFSLLIAYGANFLLI